MSSGLDPDQDRQNVGPDLVQTVCIGYQQMTKVTASKGRVKLSVYLLNDMYCLSKL